MSNSILATPLYEEVKPFLTSAEPTNYSTVSAILYAQGGPFTAWKVLSLTRIRNYELSIADVYKIVVRIGLGDYVYRVYPARSKVEILLRIQKAKQAATSEKFMAFMNIDESPSVTSSSYNNVDADTLNLSQFVDIEFDLVPSVIFDIKNTRIKGIYKNMSGKALIDKVYEEHAKPKGIQSLKLYKPDNEVVRQNMVLSDGVHVTSVPTYVHHMLGGLYNEGIGTYLQKYNNEISMYVYPLYNLTRFSSADKRAVFIIVPEGQFSELESTYSVSGDTAKIVITGQRRYDDQADNKFENDGVGFRRAAAGAMMTKPVGIKDQKVSSYSADLVKQEVIANASTRVSNRPNSSRAISDNPYLDRSKLAFKKCATLLVTWENSNDELFYPGMPCSVLMLIDGRMAKLEGVIVYSESATMLQGNVTISKTYSSTTLVKIMVSGDKFVSESKSLESSAVESNLYN